MDEDVMKKALHHTLKIEKNNECCNDKRITTLAKEKIIERTILKKADLLLDNNSLLLDNKDFSGGLYKEEKYDRMNELDSFIHRFLFVLEILEKIKSQIRLKILYFLLTHNYTYLNELTDVLGVLRQNLYPEIKKLQEDGLIKTTNLIDQKLIEKLRMDNPKIPIRNIKWLTLSPIIKEDKFTYTLLKYGIKLKLGDSIKLIESYKREFPVYEEKIQKLKTLLQDPFVQKCVDRAAQGFFKGNLQALQIHGYNITAHELNLLIKMRQSSMEDWRE